MGEGGVRIIKSNFKLFSSLPSPIIGRGAGGEGRFLISRFVPYPHRPICLEDGDKGRGMTIVLSLCMFGLPRPFFNKNLIFYSIMRHTLFI